MAQKKKRSAADMHRQVQDSLQALPHYLADLERKGERRKLFMTRFIGAPLLRLMNRIFNRTRYKGTEGQKLKQAEQLRRHMELRKQAMKHVQGEMQKAQKQGRRGKPR